MTKASRFILAFGVPALLFISLFPALAVNISDKLAADVLKNSENVAVRSGSIVLKVTDYNDARAQVIKLANARNAVLHEEKSEVNFTGERHGNIIIELDAAQLGPMIEEVRRIGKLYSELVQTTDHMSYYQKLDKRISLLKQNEGELMGFMRSPRRMRGSDILFVQYRLYESRVQAADASQERSDIARRAQKAMLNIAIFEPEPRKTFDWSNWQATASYRAKGSFLYITRKAFTGFYYILYFAPFWIPALLVLFFGGRKLIRWTKQRINGWLERRRAATQETV